MDDLGGFPPIFGNTQMDYFIIISSPFFWVPDIGWNRPMYTNDRTLSSSRTLRTAPGRKLRASDSEAPALWKQLMLRGKQFSWLVQQTMAIFPILNDEQRVATEWGLIKHLPVTNIRNETWYQTWWISPFKISTHQEFFPSPVFNFKVQ